MRHMFSSSWRTLWQLPTEIQTSDEVCWTDFLLSLLTVSRTCWTFTSFVDVDGRPLCGSSSTLSCPSCKRLCQSYTWDFFSLLCHGTLATTLLMSELVISAAKHKIYYSYGVHLQSHRILIGWRNHFSQLLVVPGVIDVWQTEIHTAESLASEPSAFEVELAIEKLKSYKSPVIDQIPAECTKVEVRTIRLDIHKLTDSVWNKEELPEKWKDSVIVAICKRGDKTYRSNYRGTSLSPTTYTILSNILLSRLTPYAEEIIGDHECGFWCNRSTTDHIFCSCQTLEKIWEYHEAVHELFIDFKKTYNSVQREVLYNILHEFGIPVKNSKANKNVSEWNL